MADADGLLAHAFHASLPSGRVSGHLRVDPHGLVFIPGDGGAGVTLPLQGLEIRGGGAANRLLFCSHPARPGWQLYTADRSLLAAPALAGHPALATVAGQRRRHHLHFWSLAFGGLASLAGLLFLLWWSLDGLSTLAARQVSPAMEERLGETVMGQYRIGKRFMEDKAAEPLLRPLTGPIANAVPERRYKLRFHIVNDPAINAFALPGGYMVINSGLILQARHASELQGVIGHEVAHVTEQHGVRAVIRSTGIFVIAQALLGDASGAVAMLANAGPLLINQAYSRDFEREADREGLALLKRANIDPRGMVGFFRLVLAEEKRQMAEVKDENARKVMDASRAFLSTHPETEERIANLEKQMSHEARAGWRDDEAAFRALQAAVRRFVADSTDTSGNNENSANQEPAAP